MSEDNRGTAVGADFSNELDTAAQVLDLHPVAAVLYRADAPQGHVLHANLAFLGLTGFSPETLAAHRRDELLVPEPSVPREDAGDEGGWVAAVPRAMTVLRADGGFFRAHVDSYRIGQTGQLCIAVVQPSASQPDRVDAFAGLLVRHQAVLDLTSDGVCVADASGILREINPAAEAMTGWSAAAAIGRPIGEVLALTEGDQPLRLSEDPGGGSVQRGQLARRLGGEMPVELSQASVHGTDGELVATVLVLRDLGTLTTLTQAFSHQALHDSLTGLPNRQLFDDRLTQALNVAGRNLRPAAILLLRIDGYSAIGQQYGQTTSDAFLRDLAERLNAAFRRTDTVCRVGADDFAVLLSEMNRAEDATAVAQKLLQAAATPLRSDEHELNVALNMGIAVFPGDGTDATQLLERARTALDSARSRGRNHFELYSQRREHGW